MSGARGSARLTLLGLLAGGLALGACSCYGGSGRGGGDVDGVLVVDVPDGADPDVEGDGTSAADGQGGDDLGGDAVVADADAATVDAALFGVSPGRITARGGVELTLRGRGFAEPVTVAIDGVPAEVLEVLPERVTARSPRLVAGPADVAVTVGGVALPPLVAAITVDPLALSWVTASPDTTAAFGDGPVTAVVAYDFDADGDLDLVAGTDDGLRVLLNDGAGRLARLERVDPDSGVIAAVAPGGRAPVRALAVRDLDGDGQGELLVGTGAGRDLVLHGGLTGLEPAGSAPVRDGVTEAIATGDFDGDGDVDAALLVRSAPGGDRGLLLLLGDGRGGLAIDPASAPPAAAEHAVGSASSTDPDATLAFTRRPSESGERGEAYATWTLQLAEATALFTVPTSLDEVPASFSVRLRRDGGEADVRPRVVDATGAAFVGPALTIGTFYVTLRTAPVAGWTRVGEGEGGPVAPITAFSLLVEPKGGEPPLEGGLIVDEIVAEPGSGLMVVVVATFDERAPRLSWPDARGLLAGELDGDAAADLVVLRAGAPALLGTYGGVAGLFAPAAVGVGASGPFAAGALLDADGDGALDMVLVSAAQDRLVVGDGWGRFIDATLGAMPVDAADGAAIAAVDLDLDGAPDVVIGNRGGSDRLYMGRGDGRFTDLTPSFGFDRVETAAVVVADLDGDGDDDVVSIPVEPSARVVVRFAEEVAP
ncbi:MAG: VCBS repeat-containing protein [Deltaproteobacteria bacterium]|nr:VCBS repeat-containing protein [Deltaproteobacteria bacterium]